MNEEQKVSQRYRELGAEEPSRDLDETILAAARRAAAVHPAPLVPPTGRRRWYFPVAAAAIIVLAVAVTVHVERERPDPESAVVMQAPAGAPERAKEKKQAEEARADSVLRQKREDQPAAPAPKPEPAPAPAERAVVPAAPPQAALPKPEATRAPEVAASRAEEPARDSAPVAGARAPEDPLRKQLSEEPPEKMLERIAELRKAGRDDEADKALEEFRKRYPGYKIPESALRPAR